MCQSSSAPSFSDPRRELSGRHVWSGQSFEKYPGTQPVLLCLFPPDTGTRPGRGSPWALVVCFVPRILVGVTPWLVYTLLQALSRRRGSVLQAGSMALSAVVGAFTNTALVMGLIALLFRDAYAAAQGIPAEAVLGFILGIVAANGVPEAIVAAILVPAVCIPMGKALKLNRAPLAAREPV